MCDVVHSLGSDRCGSSEGEHFVHVKRLFSHKRGETCYVKMTLQKKSCRCPYLGPLPEGWRGDLQLARLVSTDIDSITEQSIVILRPSGRSPCRGSDEASKRSKGLVPRSINHGRDGNSTDAVFPAAYGDSSNRLGGNETRDVLPLGVLFFDETNASHPLRSRRGEMCGSAPVACTC